MEKNTSDYTIVIFGKTGHGKSSILNKFCRKELFEEGESLHSTTEEIHQETVYIDGKLYTLIDTPGFYDTKERDAINAENLKKFLMTVKNGFNFILFALAVTEKKFDISIQMSIKLLGTLFGEKVYEKVRIILTLHDELNDVSKKKKLKLFTESLPDLFNCHGLKNIPSNFILFDYNSKDGNLTDLQKEILMSKKFLPDVLNEFNKLDFETLKDPLTLIMQLTSNSKQMQKFAIMQEDFEKISKELETKNKEFYDEKNIYLEELQKLKNMQLELEEDNKKNNFKHQAEVDKMKEENMKNMEILEQKHREKLVKMEEDLEKKDKEKMKIYEEKIGNFEKEINECKEKVKASEAKGMSKLDKAASFMGVVKPLLELAPSLFTKLKKDDKNNKVHEEKIKNLEQENLKYKKEVRNKNNEITKLQKDYKQYKEIFDVAAPIIVEMYEKKCNIF